MLNIIMMIVKKFTYVLENIGKARTVAILEEYENFRK